MNTKTLVVFTLLCGCTQGQQPQPRQAIVANLPSENEPLTVEEIPLPAGYIRQAENNSSFGYWMGKISLKPDKTVYLYDGRIKPNQSAQYAVLDISVGKRDLQQCADAVMRLRAEYLYSKGRFNEITFKDNEGTGYLFVQPYTRQRFDNYLQKVFGMCGSASLAKQLHQAQLKDVMAGDVLIRGGFPGHAAIVMDVAVNKNGNKIFLLAQSYMPAQDIHILRNPADTELSPWYEAGDNEQIITPEYVFNRNELKKW